MSPPSTSPPRLVHIQLGPAVTLYSEDYFLQALAPTGMTRHSFRALLRALSVPTLELKDNLHLIDALSLSIAFRSILRIGEPPFAAPGSNSANRQKANRRRRVDPSRYTDANLRLYVAETLAASRLRSRTLDPASLTALARTACDRMQSFALLDAPLRAQATHTRHAVQRAILDKVTDATTPLTPAPKPHGPRPKPKPRPKPPRS